MHACVRACVRARVHVRVYACVSNAPSPPPPSTLSIPLNVGIPTSGIDSYRPHLSPLEQSKFFTLHPTPYTLHPTPYTTYRYRERLHRPHPYPLEQHCSTPPPLPPQAVLSPKVRPLAPSPSHLREFVRKRAHQANGRGGGGERGTARVRERERARRGVGGRRRERREKERERERKKERERIRKKEREREGRELERERARARARETGRSGMGGTPRSAAPPTGSDRRLFFLVRESCGARVLVL